MRGHSILLIDHPQPYGASQVAAGLYNTVTGQRAARTWQADLLTDTLLAFFAQPWAAPLRPYLHTQSVYRPFRTVAELNEWSAFAGDHPAVLQLHPPRWPGRIRNELGGMEVLRTGWLDVPALLPRLHALLAETGRFQRLDYLLPYTAIDPAAGSLRIGAEVLPYAAIIFAEGVGVLQNPWWPGHRQIQPLKGQLLSLRIADLDLPYTLVNKLYLAQRAPGQFYLGATYEPRYTTVAPTEAGAHELLEQLRARILLPPLPSLEPMAHLSGLRPTSPDRRPLLGRHPHLPFYFLNGLGTKGVLQAPWCAQQLWAHLAGAALPAAIDLFRFRA
jgi:glycine/D-amino acid oxidase-like deaminating enzyme